MVTETEVTELLRREMKDSIIEESKIYPERPVFTVQKENLIEAVKLLLDTYNARLCTITAVDTGIEIELFYHMSIKGLVVNIKVLISKEEAEVASAASIIPGAASVEREISEFFQVRFKGLPDPRSLITPYEWRDVKAPLRKPMSGVVASYQKPTVETLMQQGQVFPVPASVKSHRQSLKLPEIQTTITRPEALKEIRQIAQEVEFDKKVGYDMTKNKLRY